LRPRVVILGQLSIDDVVLADGTKALDTCGGDAVYSALGAALWTQPVGVVAPAGRDFPTQHLRAIRARGLDLAGIASRSGPSIRYWVLYDEVGRRRFVQQSPQSAFVDNTPLPTEIPTEFRAAAAFHIAAMPFAGVERLLPELRRWSPEAVITLDTHEDEVAGFQDRIIALLPQVTAFLPSREEAATWFGFDDPDRAVRELGAFGQRMTIAKLGAEGSLVHDAASGRVWRVGVAPGPVVDVTGAGDAFCGGVAAGLALGDAPYEAARRGAASASLAIGGFGALHDWTKPEEARRRLDEVPVRLAEARFA
jgi:ribokinase